MIARAVIAPARVVSNGCPRAAQPPTELRVTAAYRNVKIAACIDSQIRGGGCAGIVGCRANQ